jgi:transposase InsO family protein
MRVFGLPGVLCRFSKLGYAELSEDAKERSRYISCFQSLRKQGLSGNKASEVIGVSRATLYRWEKRLEEEGLKGLEDRSRRPKRTRKPTWSADLAQAVLSCREQYPRWGKDKLVLLLQQDGWQVSTSMVGRILTRLRARGIIREAPRSGISTRKSSKSRPYAVRKPKDYSVHRPGDLIQLDTLDVRPLPGTVLKHFTACDVVSRWDVLGVYSRATANTASSFLDTILERMPFAIRAVQVDGGSEFESAFESACEKHGIRLFVLPPRSPKLNGHVERAHRTHTEEFYEVYDGDLDLPTLNNALRKWEHIYNCVRPHQALDRQTPLGYLRHCHPEMTQDCQLSHM